MGLGSTVWNPATRDFNSTLTGGPRPFRPAQANPHTPGAPNFQAPTGLLKPGNQTPSLSVVSPNGKPIPSLSPTLQPGQNTYGQGSPFYGPGSPGYVGPGANPQQGLANFWAGKLVDLLRLR